VTRHSTNLETVSLEHQVKENLLCHHYMLWGRKSGRTGKVRDGISSGEIRTSSQRRQYIPLVARIDHPSCTIVNSSVFSGSRLDVWRATRSKYRVSNFLDTYLGDFYTFHIQLGWDEFIGSGEEEFLECIRSLGLSNVSRCQVLIMHSPWPKSRDPYFG
jgi:hypothetical protein